jgi:cell division protein FtsB
VKKEEIKTKIRRAKYKISRNLLTVDNVIIVVSVIVALAWIWGSISSMERNYSLQRQLELKTREKLIAEIQYKTLEFENQYLQSEEYQELAARENLGLVAQGESVLILADYPAEEAEKITTETGEKDSNFTQWMNFIFGGNAQKSSKS